MSTPRTPRLPARAWSLVFLGLPCLLWVLLASSSCSTRERTATLAPDSTRVFGSKLGGDVTASISFTLKDSRKVEEAKRLEKERRSDTKSLLKELSRRKRDAERDLDELKKASAEASRSATKKSEGKKSGGKKKSKKSDSRKALSKKADSTPDDSAKPARRKGVSKPSALSLAAAERRVRELSDSLATLQAADSLATAESSERIQLLQAEEHAFDLEEGARIQARITLENQYGRGNRPLLLHLVWIQPSQKAAFRKMVQFVPNDSTNVLTSNFTISPEKRIPGIYRLRVYMFRELIAEKVFELRGTALGPGESEKEDDMM